MNGLKQSLIRHQTSRRLRTLLAVIAAFALSSTAPVVFGQKNFFECPRCGSSEIPCECRKKDNEWNCSSAKSELAAQARTGGVVLVSGGVQQSAQATADYISSLGCNAAIDAARRLLGDRRRWENTARQNVENRQHGNREASDNANRSGTFRSAGRTARSAYAAGWSRLKPKHTWGGMYGGVVSATKAFENIEQLRQAFANVPSYITKVLGPGITEMISGPPEGGMPPAMSFNAPSARRMDMAFPRPSFSRPEPYPTSPKPEGSNTPDPLGDRLPANTTDGSGQNPPAFNDQSPWWDEQDRVERERAAVQTVERMLSSMIDAARTASDTRAEAQLLEKQLLLGTARRVKGLDSTSTMTESQLRQSLDKWVRVSELRKSDGSPAHSGVGTDSAADLYSDFAALVDASLDPRSGSLQEGRRDRHVHVPGIQTPPDQATADASRICAYLPTLDPGATIRNPVAGSLPHGVPDAARRERLERDANSEFRDSLNSLIGEENAVFERANRQAVLDTMVAIYDEIKNQGNVVTLTAQSDGALVAKAATTLLHEHFPELDLQNTVRVMTLGGAGEVNDWRVPATHVYDENDPTDSGIPANRVETGEETAFLTRSTKDLIDQIGPEMWEQERVSVSAQESGATRAGSLPMSAAGRAQAAAVVKEIYWSIDTQFRFLETSQQELVSAADQLGTDPRDPKFRAAVREINDRLQYLLDQKRTVEHFAREHEIQLIGQQP